MATTKQLRSIIKRLVVPARRFTATTRIPPADIPLVMPRGFGLVGVFHGCREIGIKPGRAIALLMQRDVTKALTHKPWTVPIQRPGERPVKGLGLWELPANRCPAVVVDSLAGSPDFFSSEPLFHRRLVLGERFVDFDLEDILESDDAFLDRARLAQAMAPALGGISVKKATAIVKKLHYRSRFGGVQAKLGWGLRLPRGDWRYAVHLANDNLAALIGDLGSLHVWLGDGRAVLSPED